ncbi:hypothetical protein DPMN_023735 [Dreissena polymorpha]|uniref:Uncharacterized protein n=1 Tax=Dreissena polymorpha TaxID=45954 RepID=A0A9D4LMT0_DREPO|nr:hypothetical protein DPMN_023735 [Dreissena polymorpha]
MLYDASRRWQNVPSMTDSFTRPRKQKTVTMKRFRCYYCDSEFDVHKDTVHNLIEHHESLTIKYRELELLRTSIAGTDKRMLYDASRRWQNVPSMTDSFTRPRKQKTVTMKRFRCYYCDSEFDVHKDTVHNLIEHHESLTIKYRELELLRTSIAGTDKRMLYDASRRWQNVPSMTDSFTRPRKQKTVTMKRFRCYYCDSEFDVHKDTVHNLIEHHESLTIKYRELELNEKPCQTTSLTLQKEIARSRNERKDRYRLQINLRMDKGA